MKNFYTLKLITTFILIYSLLNGFATACEKSNHTKKIDRELRSISLEIYSCKPVIRFRNEEAYKTITVMRNHNRLELVTTHNGREYKLKAIMLKDKQWQKIVTLWKGLKKNLNNQPNSRNYSTIKIKYTEKDKPGKILSRNISLRNEAGLSALSSYMHQLVKGEIFP